MTGLVAAPRHMLPMRLMRLMRLGTLLAVGASLGACVSFAPPPAGRPDAAQAVSVADAADWQAVRLPGKPLTRYQWVQWEGRTAIQAQSERSASLWRKRIGPALQEAREVRFSWWLSELNPAAQVGVVERGDASARVMFGFDGDHGRLTMRNRMMFDLAQALTGEAPPFATLVYVWDPSLPVGTVVQDPRTDRIRKIVVDSGPGGLGSWRDHQRDLAADFQLAFGEPPGRLLHVALMTDSDNTASRAGAWYGPVELR